MVASVNKHFAEEEYIRTSLSSVRLRRSYTRITIGRRLCPSTVARSVQYDSLIG